MQDLLSPPKRVLVGPQALDGDLTVPPDAEALVVFAHGSGSSRRSPRNRQIAQRLNEQGLATLLFDLLRPEEAHDDLAVFDIPLLGRRLVEAIDWLDRRPSLAPLPIGLFGASTGAAAALVAAAQRPDKVHAVVSRGGRPDLAAPMLRRVKAPTLLIVGGADGDVLALNRQAQAALGPACELAVVPGASHLFMERGALERVADLAADWFAKRLQQRETSKS
jgi:putative phosphoribosyl transferase